jgi:site-specific DNA-methyltransferase (adenine-specific)
MAHWSEGSHKLKIKTVAVDSLSQLEQVDQTKPLVTLLWLPFPRTNADANASDKSYSRIADYCDRVNDDSVVCVLTTPPDAAQLLPRLEKSLQFQLWVAVKTTADTHGETTLALPQRHAALLVLTKYRGSLRHTKTRIKYTYCPACGKTTKDYGGKKHTYHEYGTMISDVWRDIESNPKNNIDTIVDRLRDLFGFDELACLQLIDMRVCAELLPVELRGESDPTKQTRTNKGNRPKVESQLINDDSLKALRGLPDNSMDFCFSDPPYNLKKKYDKWDDALESVEYFKWCDEWLSELYRVLKPNRTLAVLNIPLWAVRHYQYLNSVMDFQSWIAWDGLSFPVRMVMPAHYAIICFSKGQPRPLPALEYANGVEDESLKPLAEFYCLRSGCVTKRRKTVESDRSELTDLWYDIHRLKHNSRRVDHPCQLPPALMRRLFAIFTKPNEIILDCFNGAGTSTLVAEHMNRRFIGIELSKQYHELALKRHEQMARGIDPFGKVDSVPLAKNSPVQRLPKQKYQVSKKSLQLEVKRIAKEIGRLPTKEDVQQRSEYPLEYFEKYFVSWGEVCAAARTTGMSEKPVGLLDAAANPQEKLPF